MGLVSTLQPSPWMFSRMSIGTRGFLVTELGLSPSCKLGTAAGLSCSASPVQRVVQVYEQGPVLANVACTRKGAFQVQDRCVQQPHYLCAPLALLVKRVLAWISRDTANPKNLNIGRYSNCGQH